MRCVVARRRRMHELSETGNRPPLFSVNAITEWNWRQPVETEAYPIVVGTRLTTELGAKLDALAQQSRRTKAATLRLLVERATLADLDATRLRWPREGSADGRNV